MDELGKPKNYYGSIIRLGEENILPYDFAQKFAPITGFRNILIHEYLNIDWDEVYKNLKMINQFYKFMDYVKKCYLKKNSPFYII